METVNKLNVAPADVDIAEWVDKIINGSGGLKSFEYHEIVQWNCDRDVAIARWVIRCLANIGCKNSGKVIDAIIKQRERE